MPTVRRQAAIKRSAAKHAGFSLVEALMVVMVILIIAAIAIPSLVHGKMKANEASAVASVKNVQMAETLYSNTYPDIGFSGSLPNLGTHGSSCEKPTRTNACIIMDEALTSGLKSGYMFDLVNDGKTPALSYTVNATPESNASGRCAVSGSETGELHFTVTTSSGGSGGRSVGSGGGAGCDL
jgi:prepilin-type N-terminal cleavage/methylation domain-containing protein